jgi:hypothetical protein
MDFSTFFIAFWTLEDKNTMLPQNTGHQSPCDAEAHSRGTEMSTVLLQKPENLKGVMYAIVQEYLHLFIFNNAASSSEYVASNCRVINE